MQHDQSHFSLRAGQLSDIPGVVALANACSQEFTGIDEVSLGDYEQEWRDPAMNTDTNTRVAIAPDGALVGCVEVWGFPPYVGYWVWGRVLPSWRDRGVGTALMDWAEARVGQDLGRAPEEAQVAIDTGVFSGEQPAIDLMNDRGYSAYRYSLTMERSLSDLPPAPALPDGIVLRGMRPGEERLVYRAVDESFQDHRGHVPSDEETNFPSWLHHATARPGYDPELWLLATEGDEIAGIAMCYPSRAGDEQHGWVGTLGVRRAWRKRGVGRALLLGAFERLRERGCTRVGLGVDAHSLTGATRLYEGVGMRAVQQFIGFQKVLRPGADLRRSALD